MFVYELTQCCCSVTAYLTPMTIWRGVCVLLTAGAALLELCWGCPYVSTGCVGWWLCLALPQNWALYVPWHSALGFHVLLNHICRRRCCFSTSRLVVLSSLALCHRDRLLLSLHRALWSFLQGVSTFSRWGAGAGEGGSPWGSLAVMCTLILTGWEQLHSHTRPGLSLHFF